MPFFFFIPNKRRQPRSTRSCAAVEAGFSAAANVLLLMAPGYLLQIPDRVLPSASHATLIVLTGVAVFLSSCFGLPDCAR